MSDVVRLKITLRDTDPAIWRRVEVARTITLKDLHAIIQAAMGWENYHLYQFYIGRQTINGPGFDPAEPLRSTREPRRPDQQQREALPLSL